MQLMCRNTGFSDPGSKGRFFAEPKCLEQILDHPQVEYPKKTKNVMNWKNTPVKDWDDRDDNTGIFSLMGYLWDDTGIIVV